ncbi:MAG: hypothetical protein ABW022_28670 [Actinoplanes sp.]
MDDAGWACCCYVLVENRTAAEVAAVLGGQLSDVVRFEDEADQEKASWPAAGPAGGGWTVVVDPHFEFGDAEEEMRAWSAGGRAVRLMVIAREGFSQATAWVDGGVRWDISYEDGLDDRPRVGGALPYDVEALSAGDWYQAPISAARLATGWQPRGSERPLLAELIYPRPVPAIAT